MTGRRIFEVGSVALAWLMGSIGIGVILKIYWVAFLFGWNLIG